MSTKRKVICCVLCLALDMLCLAAKGFFLDGPGILLLALADYMIFWALRMSWRNPRKRRKL